MAIACANIKVELREVSLKDKPKSLLDISTKATVPVLYTSSLLIEESREIMLWALKQNDPANWYFSLQIAEQRSINELIDLNDNDFKAKLDKYKYAVRFPEFSVGHYFNQAIPFLSKLNQLIQQNGFLIGPQVSLADVAIFPFVRQFALVNWQAFEQLNLNHLNKWLSTWLESNLFIGVMIKYPQWNKGNLLELFPH